MDDDNVDNICSGQDLNELEVPLGNAGIYTNTNCIVRYKSNCLDNRTIKNSRHQLSFFLCKNNFKYYNNPSYG